MFLGVCQEPATGSTAREEKPALWNGDGHQQGSFVLLILGHCEKMLSLGKGISLGAQGESQTPW